MTQTPWGDASQLRERRLPPGRGADAATAARNQRERLLAAMVASSEARGYEASSVADLLELSGISSKTFYQHFTDKQDCFRAAVEEIVAGTITLIAARLGDGGASEQRARSALEAFVELVVEQPGAARMVLVESYAAGEPAIDPVRRAFDRFAQLGRIAFDQIPGHEGTPIDLARAIVGGIYQVVYSRLQGHRENELPALLPELWQWVKSYPPPPRSLRQSNRRGVVQMGVAMPPFAAYSPEQRILRGFATAVAEHGYAGTTIANIAGAASISQNTFYEHFDGKADALAAALDSSGAQMLAATLPAARRAQDWPRSVNIALAATCGFYAAEPAFARLRLVEVYAAGPEAIVARDRSGAGLLDTLLGPAFEGAPEVPTIVSEAILGAIYGAVYEQVRSRGPKSLPQIAPLLSYLALAPFVGAEEACEVAKGGGRRGARQGDA